MLKHAEPYSNYRSVVDVSILTMPRDFPAMRPYQLTRDMCVHWNLGEAIEEVD